MRSQAFRATTALGPESLLTSIDRIVEPAEASRKRENDETSNDRVCA